MAGKGELTGWTRQLRSLAGCVPLRGQAARLCRAAGRRQAVAAAPAMGGTAAEYVRAGGICWRRLPGRPVLAVAGPELITLAADGLAAVSPAPVMETTVAATTVVATTVVARTVVAPAAGIDVVARTTVVAGAVPASVAAVLPPVLAAGLQADGICVSSGSPRRSGAWVSPRLVWRRRRPPGRSRNAPGLARAAPPHRPHQAGRDHSASDRPVPDRAVPDRAVPDREGAKPTPHSPSRLRPRWLAPLLPYRCRGFRSSC
jgi:hypothetical protein